MQRSESVTVTAQLPSFRRDYVIPDDIKKLVIPALSHRVVTKGYLHGGQREAVEAMIESLVEEIDIKE